MKKLLTLITIVTFILVGCSGTSDDESVEDTNNDTSESTTETEENVTEADENVPEETETNNLTVQVLKLDEEAGLTLDNNDLYKELTRVINEDPNIGTPNDFSMHTINSVNEEKENAAFIFMAINRTDMPMKNITFNFSMGYKDGEMIWENEQIALLEDTAGVLQPNSAVPVIMAMNPKQDEQIDSLTSENAVLELSNFEYETAE
ncbi:hypothetical protein [Oceanobacillus bengalensis]|uniref:Lipoprotein n=1 Tax=Oceanobacillus bengalensis TaxID=1435466 RepID=A0A494Z2V8_9BACI|nr:hypothetical protein [Oceanobacillus bengalensis]RKQ16848.1 hypothetical protein D8M05_06230 [Oceanobacillus bengalensis]